MAQSPSTGDAEEPTLGVHYKGLQLWICVDSTGGYIGSRRFATLWPRCKLPTDNLWLSEIGVCLTVSIILLAPAHILRYKAAHATRHISSSRLAKRSSPTEHYFNSHSYCPRRNRCYYAIHYRIFMSSHQAGYFLDSKPLAHCESAAYYPAEEHAHQASRPQSLIVPN
jgi:hypothetical protein